MSAVELGRIVDLDSYPIGDAGFRARCKAAFDTSGVFVMDGFVTPAAVAAIRAEGEAGRDQVYTRPEKHTVYLSAGS